MKTTATTTAAATAATKNEFNFQQHNVFLFGRHLNYWLETNSREQHYKSIIFSVCFEIVVLKLITNTSTLVFLLDILTLLGFRLSLHLHPLGLISLATPVQHLLVLSKGRVMVH